MTRIDKVKDREQSQYCTIHDKIVDWFDECDQYSYKDYGILMAGPACVKCEHSQETSSAPDCPPEKALRPEVSGQEGGGHPPPGGAGEINIKPTPSIDKTLSDLKPKPLSDKGSR